jgi:hypothetical protein
MEKKKTEIPKEIQVYTEGCDFCMQFDYDEPHVVGASPDGEGGLEIVLKAYQEHKNNVVFKVRDNSKRILFGIFY